MTVRFLLAISLLLACSHCNVWDNVYSQTLADTPIILSESLSFEFNLRENLDARVDFNAQLETVSVFIYLSMVLKLELVRGQLDLRTLVLTVLRVDRGACERYNIAGIKGVALDQRKISKERLFLVNLLFKFIGKTQPALLKRTVYDIYKLEPFLLSSPASSAKLKDLQDDVKDNLPEELSDEFNFDADYKPNIHLYLHINSETGALDGIYSGEKQETKVPFSTVSVVKAKMNCDAEIHSMSSSDLKGLFDYVQEKRKGK